MNKEEVAGTMSRICPGLVSAQYISSTTVFVNYTRAFSTGISGWNWCMSNLWQLLCYQGNVQCIPMFNIFSRILTGQIKPKGNLKYFLFNNLHNIYHLRGTSFLSLVHSLYHFIQSYISTVFIKMASAFFQWSAYWK